MCVRTVTINVYGYTESAQYVYILLSFNLVLVCVRVFVTKYDHGGVLGTVDEIF